MKFLLLSIIIIGLERNLLFFTTSKPLGPIKWYGLPPNLNRSLYFNPGRPTNASVYPWNMPSTIHHSRSYYMYYSAYIKFHGGEMPTDKPDKPPDEVTHQLVVTTSTPALLENESFNPLYLYIFTALSFTMMAMRVGWPSLENIWECLVCGWKKRKPTVETEIASAHLQDGEMHLRSQEHANLTEMRRTQGMRDDTGNGYPMNSNSADDGAFDDLETQLSRTLTEAALAEWNEQPPSYQSVSKDDDNRPESPPPTYALAIEVENAKNLDDVENATQHIESAEVAEEMESSL